jgi:hypothetical protein
LEKKECIYVLGGKTRKKNFQEKPELDEKII